MISEYRIRPINTEQDYSAALARVEHLMEIERSPEQDDELDVLATLIELYEDRHFPMDAPDPIQAIKFRMQQLGMKQSDLASVFGSRAKASEVLSGKRALTLKMVRALHDCLGVPAEVLIREGDCLPKPLANIDLDRFPVSEMVKRGWVRGTRDIKDKAEELIRELLAAAGGERALPQALFRQGASRANSQMDVYALQAWCLRVLSYARQMGLEGIYKERSIDQKFLRDLAKLSVFDEGPKLAKQKLANYGIALVVVKHMPRTYLDGAALWTVERVPVIGMTIRHDRLDNFWFCLLHELAHLGRHFSGEDDEVFIDDLQLRTQKQSRADIREMEADEWAQEGLIPSELWDAHPAKHAPNVTNVISLARKAEVHPAIVAGRIRYEMGNYRLLSQLVGSGGVGSQLKVGDE